MITKAIPSATKNFISIIKARVCLSSLASSCLMYSLNGSPEKITQVLDLAKRAALQGRRDWYFDSLLVCTVIVAVGLFMEAPEILHDLYGVFRRKSLAIRYWLAPSLYRREYSAPDWMKVLTAVGWFLIVLGVIGEFVSEGYVNKYDTALQTLNDKMLAEALKEAGDAKTSANSAADAASRANSSADGAATKAKEAVDDLIRLRKEAGARRLTGKQKEALSKALEALPTPIAVGASPFDDEAKDFRQDFVSALSDAHWKPVRITWTPNGKYGLFVGFTDSELRNLPEVKLLTEALSDIGMPPSFLLLPVGDESLLPKSQSHVLYLLIGTRPPLRSSK